MEQYVFFEGFSSQVLCEIADASLYVLSSDYEGMPNSLMEALGIGLPCISTDCPCGGPNFLIKNKENGILVPVGDYEIMANEIVRLLKNETEAINMGENARKIREYLSSSVIAERWQAFLETFAGRQ